MSMKVQIERDAYGNIVIQMRGDISHENTAPLRKKTTRYPAGKPDH